MQFLYIFINEVNPKTLWTDVEIKYKKQELEFTALAFLILWCHFQEVIN